MTNAARRYSWKAGLQHSARDPRMWINVLVVGVAVWLFFSAPDDPNLTGIYVASAVALAVASLPQAITALTEHALEAAVREDEERMGLDEARRICLMALGIGTVGQSNAEVAATVVNALAYHSRVLTAEEARRLLGNFYIGADQQGRLQGYVDDLCTKLGDRPLFRDKAINSDGDQPG